MGEMENSSTMFVRETERNKPLTRRRHRWKHNIESQENREKNTI
jgi:hypothetical protein